MIYEKEREDSDPALPEGVERPKIRRRYDIIVDDSLKHGPSENCGACTNRLLGSY